MDFSTQQLRQQILSLAIQGKLVPQIASEGNAKDLLQKTEAECKKSNPKSKPLSPITDEEKPFEIPESWEWVRLGEIAIIRDSERIPLSVAERKNLQKIYDYYGASGVIDKVDKYLFEKPLLLIGEDGANLLSRSTPIAFIAEGKYWVNNHAHVLDFNENCVFMKYILYYINATSLEKYVTGTAQPKMNQEKMNTITVPLPPLAEQKRIVEKLEELLGELDTIEQTKEQIEHYAEQLQGQILQTAIQGKLVPQIASEGNAQDLLQKIEAERKKSNPKYKPLPPVTDEEKPFEIPESWVWVRLSSITSSILYGVSESAKTKGKYKLLRITDIQNNKVNWETVPFTDFEESKVSNYILQKDDILFARTGGTVGKSYLVNECPNNSIYASYLIRVRLFDDVYARYVKLFFESPFYWYQVIDKASGTGQPNCNGEKLTNLVLPLPPLSEQKRIVAKLEELLGEVEKLKR